MECHAGVEFDVQQVVLFPNVCKVLEDAFFVFGRVWSSCGSCFADGVQKDKYGEAECYSGSHV